MKLSVHMMILNGASVVERALRPLAALDAEVVVVDTGSTDHTPEVVEHLCGETFPGDYGKGSRLRCKIAARLTPESHPGLYFRDSASSWRTDIPGPFTGLPILRDWSVARNIGLDACEGDYILKLDSDDEFMEGATNLPATLGFLDGHPGIDFLMCPYEVMETFTPNPLCDFSATDHIETITMYDRIWRNKPAIRFTGAIHEHLLGKGARLGTPPNWFLVAQGLRLRDWRDSTGAGVRIAHRNYKVFMREYEVLDYQERMEPGTKMNPGFLLSTIGEVTEANPNLALSLLRMSRERDPGQEHDFSYHLNLGRAYVASGLDNHAIHAFREAVRLCPHSPSARLALGFGLFESGSHCRWEWIDHLTEGLAEAHAMSMFNVDHGELRRARALIAEHQPRQP
jgi:glycosyltransferase involved in cell wall biosynthesis